MLVHLVATLDNWDPKLLDLLAEKEHIIVLDLPGVGASQGKALLLFQEWQSRLLRISRPWAMRKSICSVFLWVVLSPKIVRLDSPLVNA